MELDGFAIVVLQRKETGEGRQVVTTDRQFGVS
jgi:hypothetical protein